MRGAARRIRSGIHDAFPHFCDAYAAKLVKRGKSAAVQKIYDAAAAEAARLRAIEDAKQAELEAERQRIREMQAAIAASQEKRRAKELAMRVAAENHRAEVRRKTNAVVKLGRFFRGVPSSKKILSP